MDIKLIFFAFAIHIIFFASIFDIYFTSPLVHGMTPHSTNLDPPATRLVLFVADGLRADKLFGLDKSGATRAPYLRNVVEHSGSWGVSHTRVPTESRPGHVALIAGFYEDVSAVAKGWKENPVEFDSVFNESRYTWAWGSEDILSMFSKGTTGDHMFTHTYAVETDDFAGADASKPDTWVFERVKEFFGNITDDDILSDKLHEENIVFFLYLLGLDTNGHAHKPFSSEYRDNIRLVDAGVEKMVELFEEFYDHDGKTSYLLTADHGMTDWGTHGAGHLDETMTPIVAWGSGIQKPSTPGENLYEDNFSKDWSLSHLRRQDINQADIAPLMASLIGSPLPLNSVGVLPIGYLDSSLKFKAESIFTNTKQILAQYEVKERHMKDTTLAIFFRHYEPLSESGKAQSISSIRQLIQDGAYENAILSGQETIQVALEGLNYYQTYNRLFLGTSVALSYLGWMGYILFQLLSNHTDLIPRSQANRPHLDLLTLRLLFGAIGVLIVVILYLQSSPVMYYAYCVLPVLLWHAVCQRYQTFLTAYKTVTQRYGVAYILTTMALCFFGVEVLVLSFFYREVISVGLVAIAIWPIMSTMRKTHFMTAVGWFVSCVILSVFPLLPVVGLDTNIPLVVLAGIFILAVGIVCWNQLPLSYKSIVFPGQLFVVAMATFLVYSTWASVEEGKGLPLVNQILSWCILFASFFAPAAVSTTMLPRLLSIDLAFAATYIMLSTSHEGLFCLFLCLLMLQWLLCEQRLSKMGSMKLWDVSFTDVADLNKGPPRKLEVADLRCAFFFVFFILTSFFGTGNIASVNSFDPSSVYCFLTIYNPFVMGALLLWKIAILMILVTCTFHAIHTALRVPTTSLFLVVLLMSDCMALQFFFLVRDSGSWLEIGTSISHYVIVMSVILQVNVLLLLAKCFTTFRFSDIGGKTHKL
ncbi:GPI ethanolamine phosphate transferase 1-like [Apostichopus japonicus]|uniref:GPI ethanolamine phosphate transferase 1-like n=1 Tax=Stichopus japonicus TaxID=307972 RepID=UPI003AB49166